MRAKDTVRCNNCRRLQARVEALEAELAELKLAVAQLGQQLAAARKDSSTSSKPPSSDIVKPPKPPPPQGQDKRRIGGQPGHPKHERVAFPPEAVNAGAFDHRLGPCPCCGQSPFTGVVGVTVLWSAWTGTFANRAAIGSPRPDL